MATAEGIKQNPKADKNEKTLLICLEKTNQVYEKYFDSQLFEVVGTWNTYFVFLCTATTSSKRKRVANEIFLHHTCSYTNYAN